jgi:hypothetical protein
MNPRDLHPTAALLRPVPLECPQTIPFKDTGETILFDCNPRVFALACAHGIVAETAPGTVALYCELPNLTVMVYYENLRSIHVKKGQRVKEADLIGAPTDTLMFSVVDLLTGRAVEPEFFGDYRLYAQ